MTSTAQFQVKLIALVCVFLLAAGAGIVGSSKTESPPAPEATRAEVPASSGAIAFARTIHRAAGGEPGSSARLEMLTRLGSGETLTAWVDRHSGSLRAESWGASLAPVPATIEHGRFEALEQFLEIQWVSDSGIEVALRWEVTDGDVEAGAEGLWLAAQEFAGTYRVPRGRAE